MQRCFCRFTVIVLPASWHISLPAIIYTHVFWQFHVFFMLLHSSGPRDTICYLVHTKNCRLRQIDRSAADQFSLNMDTRVDDRWHTTLLCVGATYLAVANRARPSLNTKMRSGSQAVTTTYTRRSNLNPSIRKGCKHITHAHTRFTQAMHTYTP